ncbi:DUF3993 domain-containing protein [Aneurinibacillus sp. Ricciae_BoGa-3]|uniref:DUF3993 domain-containing protein n=1 Tax=Aneurinibacillus sp. Ricciae_BoGa-3 TaxID=3022697 RepID=UPI002341F4DD|nr:DUF3993 domain-containing protein [Aneurinibacillus sp. Ricciae_BoGa-3]WCK54978.1 DUF3993 domain-containing protein [Aneurinibacillus sp. Ricciae_BoGa-3]
MKRFSLLWPVIAVASISLMQYQPLANAAVASQSTKARVEQILKDAKKAQLGLSTPMPIETVKANLGKYLCRSFVTRFIKERMVRLTYGDQKGKWLVPGSDDMYLFIPNFSWNNKTSVYKLSDNAIAVSQPFNREEGPWIEDAHVETAILTKENGKLKVQNISYKMRN